jgi:hypothetical protein
MPLHSKSSTSKNLRPAGSLPALDWLGQWYGCQHVDGPAIHHVSTQGSHPGHGGVTEAVAACQSFWMLQPSCWTLITIASCRSGNVRSVPLNAT